MKYFFGFNMTQNPANTVPDGDVFVSQRLPQTQQHALEAHREKLAALEKAARLPMALQILKLIGMFTAMVCFIGVLRADVTIAQAYINAPWVFYAGGIGAVVWAALALWDYLTGKRVKDSEEYQYAVRQAQMIRDNALAQLGVPKSAVPVDVLGVTYKVKNERVKPHTKGLTPYINPEMMVYVEDGMLHLADVEKRYSIALTSLAGIRTVKKQISIPGWNKPVAHNKGMFKEYKLTANRYGQIFIKPYYQLVIRKGNEEYLLEFPPYELPTFQQLTAQPVSQA